MTDIAKDLALRLIQMHLGYDELPIRCKLMERAPISPTFVDANFLKALEEIGIPVQTPLPYATDWFRIVNKLRAEDKGRAASWIVQLIYEEWSLMYWYHNFARQPGHENLEFRSVVDPALENLIPREQRGHSGTFDFDLFAKWWLGILAIKIRAIWDKLPIAIAESSSSKLKLRGDSHDKRLKNLDEQKDKLELTEQGKQLLEKLIKEAEDIDKIRNHRDGEVHGHTKRYSEVFGLPEKHETLGEAWAYLKPELNRCREALLTTIGLILSECKWVNY